MNIPRLPGLYSSSPPPASGQPESIRKAIRLMYAGAALAVLGSSQPLLMGDAMKDSFRQTMARQLERSGSGSEIDVPAFTETFANALVYVAIAGGLIGAGLWLWMAYANGKGYAWAQTLATVLFGIQALVSLNALVGLVMPGLSAAMKISSTLFSLVYLAVGGAAVYLLYRPESKDFFNRGALAS